MQQEMSACTYAQLQLMTSLYLILPIVVASFFRSSAQVLWVYHPHLLLYLNLFEISSNKAPKTLYLEIEMFTVHVTRPQVVLTLPEAHPQGGHFPKEGKSSSQERMLTTHVIDIDKERKGTSTKC